MNLVQCDEGHQDEHEVEGEPDEIAVGVLNEVADGLVHVRLIPRLLEAEADDNLVVDDIDGRAEHVEVEAEDLDVKPGHNCIFRG